MRLYECIVDDGHDVFRSLLPAKSKKELLSKYGGNGEFVRIKDITSGHFTDSSVELLNDNLARAGWGIGERAIICALLQDHIDRTNH